MHWNILFAVNSINSFILCSCFVGPIFQVQLISPTRLLFTIHSFDASKIMRTGQLWILVWEKCIGWRNKAFGGMFLSLVDAVLHPKMHSVDFRRASGWLFLANTWRPRFMSRRKFMNGSIATKKIEIDATSSYFRHSWLLCANRRFRVLFPFH